MLEEEDLSVTYACVKAWREQGRELFAFFNSGEHSGASQRHRHLQFLDVEEMSGGKEGEGWEVLADSLSGSAKLGMSMQFHLPQLDHANDNQTLVVRPYPL